MGCDGLADRWVILQQTYLDRLGDATSDEIEAGSERVQAAGLFIGQAMIEQVRDVQAVGCQDELVSGSEALCSRISISSSRLARQAETSSRRFVKPAAIELGQRQASRAVCGPTREITDGPP